MLLYPEESYLIMNACFNVYKRMGCGFLEAVYQECLEIELNHLEIPNTSQKRFKLHYRDKELEQQFVPDFVCYDKIIVEIKAVSEICDAHISQVLNYLHASGLRLGLLINFGHHPKVEHKRIVL